jgi:hypothetical protein
VEYLSCGVSILAVVWRDFLEGGIEGVRCLRGPCDTGLGQLVGEHRDPFDRILIAQARAKNRLLVSNEKLFDGFGFQRLW